MKKQQTMKTARIFSLVFALLASMSAWAEAAKVYVVDLNDEVDAKMWMHAKRACDEARALDADLVVVHVNTYGGAVDYADSIRTAIMRLPMPTVAFVDPNAASAGALITLACDSVYMAPGASYGASSVVNGTGDVMPDKYQSYMRSVMRSTAESHGKRWSDADSAMAWVRDPAVAEGMVGPDSVVTLTPQEAIAIGYAEGIAGSVDEVIATQIRQDYEKTQFRSTATDSILGFLASGAVRAVLIMLIMAGLYMEMHTPGIGFAGGVAFVAAVLYFLPMFVAGTMAPWVLILFLVGLMLLALEVFVIPGFGIAGITGIVAILASLAGGMLSNDSFQSDYAFGLVKAVAVTAIGLVLSVALIWYLTSSHGPQWVRRWSELQADQKVSEGYIGVDMSVAKYIGYHGESVTDLRPSGKISIDGQEFDAVSLSGFIESHRRVKVVKFENAQLYVREA